ncbi:type II secretion system F family protein [Oceanisphaera arctica]|uniref:MSHA biogenesis protein MshG n=1 Tax=Oceanisphaera arctica TaxID=641510 RepID=A0A2P5TR58_9GAMM|nr:type II secretion system F family protein [Oceanisphaera arctica]PPL18296.1 MSHA biogenesis protein MshG [Oceanisphaera arctica]GHA12111.1 MSHA biogenesis protein MshG [Oceanisphaera arctica]
MALFEYRARDRQGQLSRGTMEATSIQAAGVSLMQSGLLPIDIKPAGKGSLMLELRQYFKRGLKTEVLLILCRQLASLTRAGVPILRIMQGLAETTDNKVLEAVLTEAAAALHKGQTLSAALSAHPHIFNSLFVSLVEVGESTGQLEQTFLQLAQYYQLELDTRRRVKAAIRYPSFVMFAMSAAMVVINIYVIPAFSGMFAGMGAELPLATRLLIGSSDFFVHYFGYLLLGLMGGVMLWLHYIRTESGRYQWHRWQLKLPIVGPLLRRILLARFCRSFAMMLSAGVPITQVLDLAGNATGNAFLTRAILAMGEGLAGGRSLSSVAREGRIFTPLILQMFNVGEETGRIDEMVKEAGQFYEEEVDYDISNLSAKIEPIMIVGISVMVLILALGIFSPMWGMVDAVQGR